MAVRQRDCPRKTPIFLLEESKTEVQIGHIQTNTYHLVQRSRKIGPVYPEIIYLHLKKKKLTQARYIAQSASLPSGLNKVD